MNHLYNTFQEVLKQKGLNMTYLLRYVYLLENKEENILLIKRDESILGDTFYIGWQLFSEIHWSTDYDDSEALSLAQTSIQQFTNLYIPPNAIQLKDIFISSFSSILNIIYHIKIDDIEDFNYWFEYDSEMLWVSKIEAYSKIEIEEDSLILKNIEVIC